MNNHEQYKLAGARKHALGEIARRVKNLEAGCGGDSYRHYIAQLEHIQSLLNLEISAEHYRNPENDI